MRILTGAFKSNRGHAIVRNPPGAENQLGISRRSNRTNIPMPGIQAVIIPVWSQMYKFAIADWGNQVSV